MTPEDNKDRFIRLLTATDRQGVLSVIERLESLGFFEAPASTAFHLSERGGLVLHSLNVYDEAMAIREKQIELRPEMESRLPVESVAIAALLHDVCKSEIYVPAIKKRRNESGTWEEYKGYDVDYSQFPLGHGEKSVILLLRWGLDMTDDEIMAIRWHMEAWDLPFQSPEMKNNLGMAKRKSALLSVIKAADGLASFLLE